MALVNFDSSWKAVISAYSDDKIIDIDNKSRQLKVYYLERTGGRDDSTGTYDRYSLLYATSGYLSTYYGSYTITVVYI